MPLTLTQIKDLLRPVQIDQEQKRPPPPEEAAERPEPPPGTETEEGR